MNNTDIVDQSLYINKLILVFRSQMQKSVSRHYVNGRHSDAFVFILSGSCHYRFNDETQFTAQEGDILYLADQAIYEMTLLTENYRFIFCDFKFDHPSSRKSALCTPKNKNETDSLFRRLLRCYQRPRQHTLAESMALLYQIYDIVQVSAGSMYLSRTVQQKIEQIKLHMDQNYQDDSLSVSSLAAQGGISEVYFRKQFKLIYGISPSHYMVDLRLRKAEELMKYPFLSLQECALQSGFSSLQYFCRVFKKEKGITPARHRKELYP